MWERQTLCEKYPGDEASTHMITGSGGFMAFQKARSTYPAGVGYGMCVYHSAGAARQP